MVEFYDTRMHVYACFCYPLEHLFHCLSWLRMTSFLFSSERNDATRWLHSYRWRCIIQETYAESTISSDECAVPSLTFVSRGHVMELLRDPMPQSKFTDKRVIKLLEIYRRNVFVYASATCPFDFPSYRMILIKTSLAWLTISLNILLERIKHCYAE